MIKKAPGNAIIRALFFTFRRYYPEPRPRNMKQLLTLVLLCCGYWLFAQEPGTSCGEKKAMENLFLRNPSLKAFHEQIEARLYEYNRTKGAKTNDEQSPAAVVNLPVVVHIIHNNGSENISNAQVLAAIQHLNEAFANIGYYDPADGVNTQIQFCLAKRDPNGNATTGINRVVSSLTTMNGWQDYSNDIALKNLSRWDPRCYINIWVVKDITGGVAGYAYLPSAHGSNVDGIVLEAGYFGSSNANDVVVIHEMGHYLGLYHTFDGGCSNNDCARDGDRVCDTPPDQSTAGIGCNSSMNSCTTDTQSGFSTDQNDLTKAYMDYGNWSCMKIFTQGQSDRMNWTIQNIRQSLLGCRSCQDPCPAPVVANFNSSANNIAPGTLVNFTNASSNAAGYKWYLNNVLQSASTNFSYTFNATGTYVIRLVALPGSVLCDSTFKTDTIRVACPVKAAFTPLITSSTTNATVNFTNTSTGGAATYNWFVNGLLQGTGTNFSYAFTSAGNYSIKLRATSGTCADSIAGTVVIIDTCITQTFQKIYGGAGDDVAYDVRSTTDGGYVMAGKTNSFGSGNYDGYVVKTDALGNVQWSKVYGGAAEDVINKIMQTGDGGYVFTGTTRSYGGTFSDAWVVKLDGSGTVQWAKRFGENTAFGEQGLNICLTSDGGYAIIGSHNAAPGTSNVLVFKLDANGNLSWSKVFDSGITDGGGYITQDGDVLMATGFTRTSLSYHDALVMKIDIANGNLLWMYRYEIGGRNNFGGEIYKIGNQYKFHVPSIQDFTFLNTGRNIILTLQNDGNATAVQELIPPDNGTGPIVMAPDGGIVAAYNEQNVTSEFNIMKLGSNGGMQWAKKYTRPGPQLNYILRLSQDGGYITVGASNPAANNDIYFAKVDALGNAGGCDTAAIQVGIVTPSFSSGSFSWSINRNANFTNPQNITVQNSTPSTPSTILCSGTTCIQPPPPPVDTCKSYNFSKLIGTNGNDEAYDVKTAYDGGLIIVGKTAVSGNISDAVIIKTDAKGNIEWSKRYGSLGNDGFAKIIRTADNNYVAVGYSQFNTSHQADVYIVKIDPSGNVLWNKSYGGATPNGEYGNDIAQTADGGYVISVQYNTTPSTVQPVYMKLNASGNLQWSRMLGIATAGEALGVIPIGDVVIVGGVVARAAGGTFNDAYLAKLRLSDGALLWTKKIESENRSNRLNHLRFKNGQLSMSMYNSDSWTTGQITPMILKADTSGNITYSQSYNIAGINRNALFPSMHPTSDGGFISGVSELSSNTSPRLAKISGSGTVSWVRNYTPYFSQILYNTIEDSAGYVAVGSATKVSGGNQDILVIKTTPSGLVNSNGTPCNVTSSTATNASIAVTVTAADVNFWTNLQANVVQEIPVNTLLSPVTLVVETPCIDTLPCYIPPPDDDDTCNASTFQKLLSLRGSESAYDVKRGIGGGLILAGKTDAVTNAGTADALLIKTDRKGNIEWSKTYTGPGNDAFHFIEQTKDGNYIAVGTGKFSIQHAQDILIAKIAPNGNLIWSKAYGAGTTFGEVGVTIAETDDGGFGISVDYNSSSNTVQPMYLKIDANGNLLWSKLLAANSGEGIHVVAQGDVLIGAGISNRAGSTFADGFLVKFRQSDGALLWTKKIESQNRSNRILGLSRRGNELHINMFNSDSWTDGNVTPLVFRTDTSGNVTYSRSYELSGINRQRLQTNSQPTRDGGAIGAISEWQTNVSPKLVKISPTGQITWAKNYTTFARLILFRNLEDTIGYAAVGEAVKQGANTTQHILLMKTNADGFLLGNGCPVTGSVSTDNAVTVQSTTVTGSTYFNISSGNLQSVPATLAVADVTMNIETLCVDSTQCETPQDSCDVTLNLGPDRLLCKISTLTLNAGSGFKTYRWQDGASDSTYTVTMPGTYSVEAIDSCGNILRDTIVIAQAADVPFDLGPDLAKCDKDTLTITAPAGFTKYNWADNYNISSRYTQTVKVWPSADTTYTVTAETTNGCLVYDSIHVTVKTSPVVDLGRDTIICMNSNYTFNAGNFAGYLWQDGSVGRTFTASAIGKYWVQVTNANGCISRDTAEILKYKNCYNSIDFPNAFTPNNDRRHETYKPVVRGNISGYRFTIFNRWGQRVFATSQINHAWDGTIAGKPQDTGTFVWVCEYQFAGEEKKVAKGTLLLIR